MTCSILALLQPLNDMFSISSLPLNDLLDDLSLVWLHPAERFDRRARCHALDTRVSHAVGVAYRVDLHGLSPFMTVRLFQNRKDR